LTLDDNSGIIIAQEREKEMQKIMVGDVVQVVDGYGIVQQIIGKNLKIRLSGRYGEGEWYTLDQIVCHAALSRRKSN
jgi:hypothetical protein